MGAYFGMANHTLSSIASADSPSIDCEQNPEQLAQILTPTVQTITAGETTPTKRAPGEEHDLQGARGRGYVGQGDKSGPSIGDRKKFCWLENGKGWIGKM